MQDERGQALVETALVVPLFLFTFLVLLQLMLVAHARVLVDYAAFNACRAGVVHNGNNQIMRSAAFISVLPVFGKKTSDAKSLAEVWALASAAEAVGTATSAMSNTLEKVMGRFFGSTLQLPTLEIVQVDVLNPRAKDFGDKDEIDLDLAQNTNPADLSALSKTRLSIRVRVLYPMRVPVANRLLFYGFMAAMYFNTQLTSEDKFFGILDPRVKTQQGLPGETAREFLTKHTVPLNIPDRPLELPSDIIMYNALKTLSSLDSDWYLMPLYAFYSMPMESNFFKDNLTPGALQ